MPIPQIIESQFRQAMAAGGINYSGEIIPDGNLHRFHIEGHKQGSLNGAYTLHLNGRPAGYFQDYKTGIKQTWSKKGVSGSGVFYDFTKQINKARILRQKHAEAAIKAKYIWNRSKPVTNQSDHAYLVRKHIQPNGARLYRESLVIRIVNAQKRIVNLQFVNPQGEKHFLTGSQKHGCFCPIGQQLTPRILICEGFATGATLHEETDLCVMAAMDVGNLKPVAEVIRNLFPVNEIFICGDNDLPTKEYPAGQGQTKAKEAALAIGGLVLIPATPGMDWNDAAASHGGYRHD